MIRKCLTALVVGAALLASAPAARAEYVSDSTASSMIVSWTKGSAEMRFGYVLAQFGIYKCPQNGGTCWNYWYGVAQDLHRTAPDKVWATGAHAATVYLQPHVYYDVKFRGRVTCPDFQQCQVDSITMVQDVTQHPM